MKPAAADPLGPDERRHWLSDWLSASQSESFLVAGTQMMQRSLFALAFLLTPAYLFADQAIPPHHSTVHIVFAVPTETAPVMDGTTPLAKVRGLVAPIDSIRPISIEIDGEFVGHALIGFQTVEPVFVLPSGNHKFTFSCDGYKKTAAELKVLGTGSTQYLIVKLAADSPTAERNARTPAKTTTVDRVKR